MFLIATLAPIVLMHRPPVCQHKLVQDEASSTDGTAPGRISFLSWTATSTEGVSSPPNRVTHEYWLRELDILRRSIALHPVGFENHVRKKRGQSGYWKAFQGLRSIFVS